MTQSWEEAQKWEKKWHDNCVNSLNEELKQLVYARKMGLVFTPTHKTPYNLDLRGKSVLDIGGGAYSLLLKAVNFKKHLDGGNLGACVIDPLDHPEWVKMRYQSAGIFFKRMAGEDINTVARLAYEERPYADDEKFDEIWIYNCLQHVRDPQKIIANALAVSKLIRIFEWVDIPTSPGHLHVLKEEKLNEWLGGEGKVEVLNEYGCNGKSYYGIFPTEKK